MSITSAKSGATGISLALDNNFMEPIASTLVGSGGVNTVIFNDIPQNYKHLQIRFLTKSSYTTGTSDSLYGYFNQDSGTTYSYHFLRGNGAAASASGDVSTSFMWLGNQANSGTGTTNTFGVGVCDILDYSNTSKNKTIRSLQGYDTNGDGFVVLSSSCWRSVDSVTSLKFIFGNGNIAQYSRFSLYGIKG